MQEDLKTRKEYTVLYTGSVYLYYWSVLLLPLCTLYSVQYIYMYCLLFVKLYTCSGVFFFTLVIHKNRVHLNCTIWYWTHMQRIWILIKLKNKFNSIPRCTRSLSSNTRPLLIQANSRDRIFQTAVFIWSWIPSFLNKTQYHFRFRVNCMFEKFSPISRHVLN